MIWEYLYPRNYRGIAVVGVTTVARTVSTTRDVAFAGIVGVARTGRNAGVFSITDTVRNARSISITESRRTAGVVSIADSGINAGAVPVAESDRYAGSVMFARVNNFAGVVAVAEATDRGQRTTPEQLMCQDQTRVSTARVNLVFHSGGISPCSSPPLTVFIETGALPRAKLTLLHT